MFYTIFIELCDKNNIKPSNLLSELGLSTGNLQKWKNGAKVNSDILLAVSAHFGVTIDYLLTGKEKSPYSELDEKEQRLLKYFKLLNPDEKIEIIGELKGMTRGRAESKNAETA